MKRITALVIVLTLVLGIWVVPAQSADLSITIRINGVIQDYDPAPILITIERGNYQVLAPARQLMETLDGGIEWNNETQQITCTKNKRSVVLTVDSETGNDNGEEKELVVPAQLVNDTAYIPIEFLGNALGYHVMREQYGRYIRLVDSVGVTRALDADDVKKPGMAELVSTVHRDVETKFEKSNRLDDLLFYTDYKYVPAEELLAERTLDTSKLPTGEVIYDNDDFLEGIEDGKNVNGSWGVVDVNDESVDFKRALRISCVNPPSSTVNWIVKPDKRIEEYVDAQDKYRVIFYARLVDGGHVDTGLGKVFVHVEEDYKKTWMKSVEQMVTFTDKWQKFETIATGIENANHIGVTAGFYKQTIEIGGFEVQKLDRDADISEFERFNAPVDVVTPYLSKDAPWRAEALERIEKIRKGDFKVVVKDADGNPVPNADVRFDMFEHEFKFGGGLDSGAFNPIDGDGVRGYMSNIAKNCNALVCGNATKMTQYDLNPALARRIIDDCFNMGVKYVRGHAIWMPSIRFGDVGPYRFFGPNAREMSWDTFEKYMKSDINTIAVDLPEIYEWDVTNEMTNRVTFDPSFGEDYEKAVFKWCREILPEGTQLAHCDNQVGNQAYLDRLDRFLDAGVDYDVIADQGHSTVPEGTGVRRIPKLLEYYDRFSYEYGKNFSITEFSCYADKLEDQADTVRDTLIAVFSHPKAVAFTMFWISDLYTGATTKAGCAPLFDRQFNKKPGWYQWNDLLYNKWWTRDEHTVTDSDGKGQVRGFYGDYDVTVTVDGEEVKTEMAAFHKGYENELVITLDKTEKK